MQITLVSIGKVDAILMDHVKKGLRSRFKIPVLNGSEIRAPSSSFNKFRNQYEADIILNELEKNFDDKVLAITNYDIYTQRLNYIFGLAKVKSKSAIVSIARLDPKFYKQPGDIELLKERLLKECIHEIGHVLGLQHCKEKGCVMNPSNNTRDIDNKNFDFCHMCQISLGS
ncbi:MAG: archaemetzincin family Zn-dependent metalloprotease [Candidatus Aenigmatarchaeota archaeon]